MKTEKREILIRYELQKNKSELPQEDVDLVNSAIKAAEQAYAPYSRFRVGAALLLENGKIIIGSNQENAAYPSGLCAERVAAFSAGSSFPEEKMIKMAIVALREGTGTYAVSLCGSCRQVLLEYELKQKYPVKIILSGENDSVVIFNSVKDLLPMGFSSMQLNQK